MWIVGSYFHYSVPGGFTDPKCADITPKVGRRSWGDHGAAKWQTERRPWVGVASLAVPSGEWGWDGLKGGSSWAPRLVAVLIPCWVSTACPRDYRNVTAAKLCRGQHRLDGESSAFVSVPPVCCPQVLFGSTDPMYVVYAAKKE